ncbi:hypothetical protein V6N13_084235 [Hibiscus sabdariffa]|uniref:Pectinesterase inhibitor domain-containing protein n=1 Tax=Hibiscus sabdariffa TaxID=183260 RepID=A0ABR2T182_9ROSI
MFSLIFLPAKSQENNASLVETTCKSTPFYNLCVSTLESDPDSSRTDIPGLAIIGANRLNAKVYDSFKEIASLLEEAKDESLKKALVECDDHYKTIITYNVLSVIKTVRTSRAYVGRDAMNDAAKEALACASGFENQPTFPIKDSNKVVHDLSAVVSSIITLLVSE